MKRFLFNSASIFLFLLIVADGAVSVPYSLRKIQRNIYEMEYDTAREDLMDIMGSLSGTDLAEGKLMLALLEDDADRSIDIYEEIVDRYSGNVGFKARTELAKLFYATGEYGKAIKVVEWIPGSLNSDLRMEALYFRGLSYKQLGSIDRARSDFRSVDKGVYLYRSYMELAELDMQTGDYRGAIELYETIGGIHSNPIAVFKLGECYEILGDTEKAFDMYVSLERRFPRSLESPKARDKIRILVASKDKGRYNGIEGGEIMEAAGDDGYESDVVTSLYTIQFGAFESRANAARLYESLSDLFPDVRIETIRMDSGNSLYRVRVGRYADRHSAEDDSSLAIEKYGYSSKILTVH